MNRIASVLARFMWMPISTAPKQKTLLVSYCPYKHPWVTMAAFYAEKTLEASDDNYDCDDDGYVPAGWYEQGCETETFWHLTKDPTHWRRIPRACRRSKVPSTHRETHVPADDLGKLQVGAPSPVDGKQ